MGGSDDRPGRHRANPDAVVRAAAHAGQRISRRAHLHRPRRRVRQRPDRQRHLLRDRLSERQVGGGAGARLADTGVHRRHGARRHTSSPAASITSWRTRCAGRWPSRPSRWAIIGFVPASVPHSYVTVPISFLAAIQIGLFRNIGDLAYLPVATTGNMMRFMESGYDAFVEKHAESRRAFGVYGALIVAFAWVPLSAPSQAWPGECTRSGCPPDSSQ